MKRLHNLYSKGQLKQSKDGLFTISNVNQDNGAYQAISVPTQIFPGLVQALHLTLQHPSKCQLQRLVNRYFYTPGAGRIIEEITSNCVTCASLKELPEILISESTVKTPTFGANFSADIVRAHGQKILIIREKLSQFTLASILKDETAECIKAGIIALIVDFIPSTGAVVQVDCATSFQTLQNQSNMDGTTLHDLGIKIDLGRTVNANKNPIAENAIKEYHKERLRLDPQGGPVTKQQLAIIIKNMNSRIRTRGLSSKEIVFRRDQFSNIPSDIKTDHALSEEQYDKRTKTHINNSVGNLTDYSLGDNVFLRRDKNKLRGRQMYKILNTFIRDGEPWLTLQKADTQFRAKSYDVKESEIIPIPGTIHNVARDPPQNQDMYSLTDIEHKPL